MTEKSPHLGKQTGFTLLEVLIAIVIFAIGLLGIASLQATGLRQTHNSTLRSVATEQAQAMADRMRANTTAVDAGTYDLDGSTGKAMPTAYLDGVNCRTATCTSDQLAVYDLVEWLSPPTDPNNRLGLDSLLPSGTGVVCIDSTPNDGTNAAWACDETGDVYAVKIQWTERDIDAAEGDADGVTTRRFVLRVKP